jgi:site-specific DNA recombinase
MRLSKEDENSNESSSIGTQRKMLRSFAAENGFYVFNEYVDDGYSGTNFERPAFRRLIEDIKKGNVNLVITKDLSRLGRDYITTGQYTEKFFPEQGVRYIAINDGYDSISPYNDIAPFKNVINEMYARDTSKKIRSAFQTKMREGAYIGNFAPYGYEKDPGNKNHLVIDYEAAQTVKEIFAYAEQGLRPKEIAERLNIRGVLTPAMYRCKKRPYLCIDHYSHRKEWTSSTISKMLHNIVYLGHTAQGKTTKVSFKSRVTLSKPAEDWIIIKNTHEPIVSQSTFDVVSKRAVSRRNTPKTCFSNVFSGIAKCADCGRNMSTTGTRKKGAIANFVCSGYKLYGSSACTNHFIDYENLYQLVLAEIQERLKLSEQDKSQILDELEKETVNVDQALTTQQQQSLAKRIRALDVIIQKLYEDNASGIITDERYKKLLRAYEREQQEASERLESLIQSTEQEKTSVSNFSDLLAAVINVTELTPGLLHRFIDHIEISQGNYIKTPQGKIKTQTVKIFYKFIKSDMA